MTRSAGRVRKSPNLTDRVGSIAFQMSGVGSGRVKSFFIPRAGSGRVGSGRVGSRGFQISRVGSGQEFFKSHGSGRVESRGDEKLTGRVRP